MVQRGKVFISCKYVKSIVFPKMAPRILECRIQKQLVIRGIFGRLKKSLEEKLREECGYVIMIWY